MPHPTFAAIGQPRYLPACNYLHRMLLCDVFVWLDTVQYTPRDFENRNKIKTLQGAQWLTVPVNQTHREQPIHEITVDNTQPWGHKHWETIKRCYAKAPHFAAHADFLEQTYLTRWGKLTDLNEQLTLYFAQQFGVTCKFLKASELHPAGKGQELLASLCREVGATVYISGALGRDYIDEEAFRRTGLGLWFHDYHHPVYPQLFGDFVPYMSVLDLLMNCGAQSADILRQGNVTKEQLAGQFS